MFKSLCFLLIDGLKFSISLLKCMELLVRDATDFIELVLQVATFFLIMSDLLREMMICVGNLLELLLELIDNIGIFLKFFFVEVGVAFHFSELFL